MHCNSGAAISHLGVSQDITVQYMYKQAVIHTTLSNRVKIKLLYMTNFMFVDASIFEFLEFNSRRRS